MTSFEMAWIYLLVYVFPILSIFSTTLLVVLWFIIIPKPAKQLVKKRMLRKAVTLIESHDTGETEILLPDPLPEGQLMAGKKYFMIPRSYKDWMAKRFSLKGLGGSFLMGYSGKAAAVTPETMFVIEKVDRKAKVLGEDVRKSIEGKLEGPTPTVMPTPNPTPAEGSPVAEAKLDIATLEKLVPNTAIDAITLLDSRKLKQYVTTMISPSQILFLIKKAEMKGMEQLGIWTKRVMLIIIPLIIVVTFCLLIAYIFIMGGWRLTPTPPPAAQLIWGLLK